MKTKHDSNPDKPIDLAVSVADEEPPFVGSSPDAPSISEQGSPRDEDLLVADHSHPELTRRMTAEVLEHQLRISQTGSVEEDLARNFAPDLVVLTAGGVHRGFAGMRALAARLRQELPEARFTYRAVMMDGAIALLEWSGEGMDGSRVEDGADTYLIECGKIRVQTISYTVLQP